MPYFITDSAPGCSGWATIKEDGEVIGCHTTKQAAVDQMVAVSIAEDMEPGGERALGDMLMIGDYVSFDDKVGEIQHIYREGKVRLPSSEGELTATTADPVAIIQVYEQVEGGFEDTEEMVAYNFSDLTRIPELEEPEDEPESEDEPEDEDEMEDRELPSNYRPAASADVPANHNCGNCGYYKNFYCKRWDALVAPAYYCNAWEPVKGLPNDNPGQTVQTGNISGEDAEYYDPGINIMRQLSFDVPVYIRSAARKGLDYYGQGLAGDGLVARTVREARDMAAGRISEDKVIRANAWGARHLVDLQAPKNSDPDNDQFPGPGAVAFYLWGINPLNPKPAMDWFERQAERVKAERADAPAPKKDQIKGSAQNPEGSASGPAGSGTIELDEQTESGLRNKVEEHNDSLDAGDPSWKRATVGMLRAVYRRGAGAYSTSHRPGVSRGAWAMARVNAFLVLLKSGRPANASYITDNDLLPKGHPRSSRN